MSITIQLLIHLRMLFVTSLLDFCILKVLLMLILIIAIDQLVYKNLCGSCLVATYEEGGDRENTDNYRAISILSNIAIHLQ